MNNESAFPIQSVYIEDQDTNSRGMSLRDYFAAKAMSAYIGRPNLPVSISDDELATACYEMADAMLKERES